MYLIFPESIIIPEVSNRREDYDFEDWLTAALIENANQDGLNGNASSARDHRSLDAGDSGAKRKSLEW